MMEFPVKSIDPQSYEDQEIVRDISKMKSEDIVEEICNSSEYATKNDLILCMEFWKRAGQISMKVQNDNIVLIFNKSNLNNITMPETISRIRRKLHKDKRIFYNEETERLREKRRVEMKEEFRSSSFRDFEGPYSDIF